MAGGADLASARRRTSRKAAAWGKQLVSTREGAVQGAGALSRGPTSILGASTCRVPRSVPIPDRVAQSLHCCQPKLAPQLLLASFLRCRPLNPRRTRKTERNAYRLALRRRRRGGSFLRRARGARSTPLSSNVRGSGAKVLMRVPAGPPAPVPEGARAVSCHHPDKVQLCMGSREESTP